MPQNTDQGSKNTAQEIRDAIVDDDTRYSGADIDAAISSRSELAQADILSDATPFAGGDIDAAISSRSTLAQADILSDGTAFAGGNINAAIDTRAVPGDSPDPADYTSARATNLDNLDAAVATRATPSDVSARAGFETTGSGTLSADGTEQTVATVTPTNPGVLAYLIDLGNMQAGDTVVIRDKADPNDDASYEIFQAVTYEDVQTNPVVSPVDMIMITNSRDGRVTLEQTAGTDRDYPYVAGVKH